MLLHDALKDRRIVLGSASPRRRELLAGLGLEFTVEATPGAPETYSPDLQPDEIPSALAVSKSEGFHRSLERDEILITADTVVICGEDILGKPADRDAAARMLRELSGRTHRVVTGVCLRDTERRHVFSCTSEVEFKTLTEEEISYILLHRPLPSLRQGRQLRHPGMDRLHRNNLHTRLLLQHRRTPRTEAVHCSGRIYRTVIISMLC